MISIESDDGQEFTISKGDIEFTATRRELEVFLDEANVLLLVTGEREIIEIDDI